MYNEDEKENEELLKKLEKQDISLNSDIAFELISDCYDEKPVDITTFIEDENFLGSVLNGILYDKWKKLLQKIHPSPFVNSFYEIILEAPLSSGKSYISSISIIYEVYKLLCLKNPQAFYNLGAGTRIYFIIFSVDLNSADLNWNYIKTFIQKSPWFQKALLKYNTKITKGSKLGNNEQLIAKDVYIALGSNTDHSISRRVFGGVLDEGNFQKGAGSSQAYENYEAMITRIEASFSSEQGVPPGILWLVSSPTFESSFITDRISAAEGIESTLVVENIPIWVLKKNSGTYKSGKYFEVFIGDGIRDPFIVSDENRETLSLEQQRKFLLKVPMEHYTLFKKRTAKALRDLAGRRVNANTSFFKSKDELRAVMTMPNLFYTDVIPVGMKSKLSEIINLIKDINYFKNPMYPFAYRFVHIDIGAKIDRLGIASTFAIYKDQTYYSTPDSVNERSQRMFFGEWGITLQAKENDEIPFSLVVDFLVYLKSLGYPIILISTDQMEGGRKLRQDLIHNGFECEYRSVDKDRNSYDTWKDLIQEQRNVLPQFETEEHGLLFLEASELIDKGNKSKPAIDHPKNFKSIYKGTKKGYKDLSDAYCGSTNSCNEAKHIFNPLIMFKNKEVKKANNVYNERSLQNLVQKLSNGNYG